MEVKDRIWVVSNLTRLNSPESSIGISSWYTGSCSFPLLQWQGKKYLVYLAESIGDVLSSLIPLKVQSHVYRIEIPCWYQACFAILVLAAHLITEGLQQTFSGYICTVFPKIHSLVLNYAQSNLKLVCEYRDLLLKWSFVNHFEVVTVIEKVL